MENEVRQLEMEQEKIIQTKEKEMLEHLLKQGRHSGKLGVNYLAKNTFITLFETKNEWQKTKPVPISLSWPSTSFLEV